VGFWNTAERATCPLTSVVFGDKLSTRFHSFPQKEVADTVTDRIRFIAHQGKQILLVDLSNCSAAQVEKLIKALPGTVTTCPRNSVLILSDFSGASFDQEAIRAMKEAAVFDKPYIKKSAWIGAENFPAAFFEDIINFSRRKFPTFKNRDDALTWLVKD
jgi:hypothetical protein